jgi:lipopolysaccharide/colanic/teichoic acid biosynthesis glycosyltransferase
VKRLLDLLIASVALISLAPIILVAIIVIRVKLGTPIFFRQVRPGKGGVPFRMIKFRTMSDARDASGALLSDEHRLGSLGRFLRATSVDELPELWNVIRGEMSIVGPRPLLMHYLPHYSREQARRHEVRPGITGWAQVNGRNALSWEEKFAYDVWYVDHQSLWLDLKIMLLTLRQVITRAGISSQGHATMPEFAARAREEDNHG